MADTKPTKFEDLKPTELYRSAIEDFAVPVDETDKNKKTVLLAALLESGIKWEDYVAQHPEVAPDEPVSNSVITSEDVAGKSTDALSVEPVEVLEQEVVIRTAEAPKPQVNEKFLIKMTRDNPRFDVLGHRFTQEHPYALVDEDVAESLLTKEEGFRMATPSELREYYG